MAKSQLSKLNQKLAWSIAGALFVGGFIASGVAPGQSAEWTEPSALTSAANPTESVDANRIVVLIEQLGAPSFRQRELAARELRSVGVAAFSLLRAHRNSQDPEIRQRVRKLVAEILPQMMRRDVPDVEASFIKDYLRLDEQQRRNRIILLSRRLMPDFGSIVLLRIAQLDLNSARAKMAAAGLLGGGFPKDESQLQVLRQNIHVMGNGVIGDKHPGLSWIQEFRRSLDNPQSSIGAFETFADDEQALLRGNPIATDEQQVIWPLRRYALDLRMQAGLDQEAADYAAELFQRSQPESIARQSLIVSMFQRQYYELLLRLGEDNSQWFASHRFPQYLRAAAAESMGETETAERLLGQAFASAEDEETDRLGTASLLRTAGIHKWCEREYRAVFERSHAPIEPASFEARRLLANVLHQQQRYQEATKIMQDAVELCEKDPTGRAEEKLEEVPLVSATLPQFQADLHFFEACAAGQKGDIDAQIEHFREAFVHSKDNSDALCEAYKIKEERWQAELSEIVDETLAELLEELSRYEMRLLHQPDEKRFRDQIAQRNNEIAWILVNTGGNLNNALRHAQQSVETNPGLAYSIDTLATCYFALEEFDRAIEYERLALRLEPYREDVARTLQQFIAGKAAKGED